MPKRDRENALFANWSKRQKDVMFHYPSKSDGHWLHCWFSWARVGIDKTSFLEQLEERGYDITTLRFSVKKDPNHPRWTKKP